MRWVYCLAWFVFWVFVPITIYQIYFMPHYDMTPPIGVQITSIALAVLFSAIAFLPIVFRLAFGCDEVIMDDDAI